jgi:hypothetical protein
MPSMPDMPDMPDMPELPELPEPPARAPRSHGIHMSVSNGSHVEYYGAYQTHSASGSVSQWRWKDGDSTYSVEQRGEFGPSTDDVGVEWIDEHASLTVEREGSARIQVLPGPDGEPTLVGTLGGRAAEEPALRAALAELMPIVLRHTGAGAAARTRRLHEQGGTAGVLAEIERLSSDHARLAYYDALLGEHELPREERVTVARQADGLLHGDWVRTEFVSGHADRYLVPTAGGAALDAELADALIAVADDIESDSYLTEALTEILEGDRVSPALTARILVAARSISSDAYAAELLSEIGSAPLADAEVRQAWLALVAQISSDAYMTELLAELLEQDETTPELATSLLELAAEQVASDAYMAELLTETSHSALAVDGVREAWMAAFGTVSSDAYACEVIVELIDAADGAAAPIAEALRCAAASISSDSYMSEVLLEVPRGAFAHEAVLKAYLEAAATVSSTSYREEILRHLPKDKRPEQA